VKGNFSFLELIETGDFLPLLFTACVVLYIGQMVVGQDGSVRQFGSQVATAAFVGYIVYHYLAMDFPIAMDLVSIVLRAVVVGLFTLGTAWILLPLLLGSYRKLIAEPYGRWQTRSILRRREREQRRRQKAEELEREKRRAEWELSRPQREQAAREESERHEREQRRRESVRFEARLLYDRYAGELKDSFPRKRFDEYLVTYLSDDFPADLVAERGKQLQAMILDHFDRFDKEESWSHSQIVANFQEERRQITQSSLDEETKAAYLADLNFAEELAIQKAKRT